VSREVIDGKLAPRPALTFSRHPLLSGSLGSRGFFLEGQTADRNNPPGAYIHIVRANFSETMELPVQLGRGLSPRDDANSPRVAVINQTLARRFFHDENPIGKLFRYSRPFYMLRDLSF
jgi:putative ABC transport system permease protein